MARTPKPPAIPMYHPPESRSLENLAPQPLACLLGPRQAGCRPRRQTTGMPCQCSRRRPSLGAEDLNAWFLWTTMAGIRWGGGRERETQWDEDKYIRLGAMAHWAWLSKCDRCRAKCAGERLPVATFPRILDHVCTVHVVCEMVRRGQLRFRIRAFPRSVPYIFQYSSLEHTTKAE